MIDKIKTHSLYSISHHIKCYLIDLYSHDCSIIDYYICNNIWEWQVAEVAEVETLVLRPTVIADRSLGSRNGNPGGGRRLVSGRWFLRFSKDTNGSITLRSISTSDWMIILFAMASLIELYPPKLMYFRPRTQVNTLFSVVICKGGVPATHRSCISRLVCIESPVCYLSPNWTWRYIVHPSLLRMLFLFGWPPCQRSDMTLVEVSRHAYDYLYIRTILLFVFLRNSC